MAERAKDLAAKLSPAQIAGLMPYSAHQAIPAGAVCGGHLPGQVRSGNLQDIKTSEQACAAMKGKPVIVDADASKPFVPAEFEKCANELVVGFGASHQAMLDVLTDQAEPRGLLPVQLPASLQTVEQQNEDIPHNMECYRDAAGHRYDFGYGLNWRGVMQDARPNQYANWVARPVISLKGKLLIINCAMPGAKLCYTTTGATSAFTAANEYRGAFALPAGATVRALAKMAGVDNSSLVSYAPTAQTPDEQDRLFIISIRLTQMPAVMASPARQLHQN
ncbi:MAG: hypothetical protein ACRYFK_03645 [Janthinobacterium lividum]